MRPASLAANDPYETLIKQMIALERRPQQALKTQKGDLQVRRGALTDFDSALSALRTALRRLTDPVTNPFAARRATLPENAGLTATAGDRAAPGTHTIHVERLATADTRVSDRLAAGGTRLADFFAAHGAQTFTLEVGAPTASEPARRVALEITVAPQGTTDAEILAEIRAALREAVDAAVVDGRLERRHAPTASVVRETADTARLTLRAAETGFAGRLAFTDSADGLLAALGLARDALAAGDEGGQITRVGTTDADSELNARFTLDGLTLVRSTNEVRDALDHVTLSLTRPGEPVLLRIGSDPEATREAVEAFVEKYNAVQDFLRRRTAVDGTTGRRGDFAGDAAFRTLRFGLRSDLVAPVPGQPDGAAALADLGLELDRDGRLKLKDAERLAAAAERDPTALQRLFAAEDGGLGTRLLDRLEGFLGRNGVLHARKTALDARTRALDARIRRWDEQLAVRERVLRKQFNQLQEVTGSLRGQFGAVSAFLYGPGVMLY